MASPEAAGDIIRRCREYAEKYEKETEDENEALFQESSDESEIWDCETIVSTYSNLDNHPGKIGAPEMRSTKKLFEISGPLSSPGQIITLKGKQRLPVDFLPGARKNSTDKVKNVGHSKPEQPDGQESKEEPKVAKRKPHGQESKEEKKERKVCCLFYLCSFSLSFLANTNSSLNKTLNCFNWLPI